MTGQIKILIADDHAGTRKHLRDCLRDMDMTVVEAADGKQAVACFEREHPDWTLMDIEMPVLDGIQATRAILKHDPGAQVIMVTQYADAIWKEEALKAGACGFLVKDDLSRLGSMLNPDTTQEHSFSNPAKP